RAITRGCKGVNMSRIGTALLAPAGLVALASAASAADLAPAYKAPPPVAPACAQFGGFYVGAFGAWTVHDWNWRDRDGWVGAANGGGAFGNTETSSKSGAGAGILGGWNYQARCTGVGAEADWTWGRINAPKTSTDGGIGIALDAASVQSNLKSYGTFRTRTGVVVDNVLLYVTGGFAVAKFDRLYTLVDVSAGTADAFNDSSTRWGGVVGVGAEWAAWGNFSIKSEFLYARFRNTE